ncbi:MAG: isopentenyl phosphate kinase family protein [Candidatus Thermoplasmatota archaeon]|nr:isopentenyl phosphate kinase family protein [Candidatus Thermoplasmatota archaeon]
MRLERIPMILVKLGGSVITDKSRLRTFRRSACDRLAREMRSGASEGILVVHGAGSFGHIVAKKYALHKGLKYDSQVEHVATVQRDVRELNLRVLESLIDAGLNAVSVPPASSSTFENGCVKTFSDTPFSSLLDMGLVPVSFGDVVPDMAMGFSICSGDLMMAELAKAFKPRLVVFCADVDGVFDKDPKLDKSAKLLDEIDSSITMTSFKEKSVNADVTGSMKGKIEMMLAISEHCEKCIIVNGNVRGRLESAIKGTQVKSTTVVPRQVSA